MGEQLILINLSLYFLHNSQSTILIMVKFIMKKLRMPYCMTIQLVGFIVNFCKLIYFFKFNLSNQIMSKFYVFKLISHFDC